MAQKEMLILVASEDIHAAEVVNVESQARLYGINSEISAVTSFEDLYKALKQQPKRDYIYLATHGCESYWGNISGTLSIQWMHFAACVCITEAMKPGAIFLHSCCRGGLNQVAHQMFSCCNKVEFICGPRSSLDPVDLVMAFNLFLYNIETKKVDPVRAAEKVLAATDIRLKCYDRVEHCAGLDYQNHCNMNGPQIDEAFLSVDREERKILGLPPISYYSDDEEYEKVMSKFR